MIELTQEEVDYQKKLYDDWLNTVRNGKEYTAFGLWLASAKCNKNKPETAVKNTVDGIVK